MKIRCQECSYKFGDILPCRKCEHNPVIKLQKENDELKIIIDFKINGLSINGLAKKYKITMNKVDEIIRKQLKDK